MEKVVWWLGLNCPIDVLCKSVDWFIYNDNISLNGKELDTQFCFYKQLHFSFQYHLFRAKLLFQPQSC